MRKHPNDFMLATTAADIRRAAAEHKIAALMGMEGGHMIDNDLRAAAHLRRARRALPHADAFEQQRRGPTRRATSPPTTASPPFGKDVVRELNRLGMMVDISHVADKTFFDTLEVTKAPVIASHSSVPRDRECIRAT